MHIPIHEHTALIFSQKRRRRFPLLKSGISTNCNLRDLEKIFTDGRMVRDNEGMETERRD